MDALKFAFEILIVGALALPWLAVLIQMFSRAHASTHPAAALDSFLSVVPRQGRGAVGMVVLTAVGYLVGSAISRTSRNFFNDELLKPLPTEDQVRENVYYDEYCAKDVLDEPDRPGTGHKRLSDDVCQPPNFNADAFEQGVSEWFPLQEGELLLNGQDKVGRLKEYFDQIDVLRGAALNGIILLALCGFGCCANVRARPQGRRIWKVLVLFPAPLVIAYGVYSLLNHLTGGGKSHGTAVGLNWRYIDPPLAEVVLLMLGGVGLYVMVKAKTARLYFPTFLAATVLTIISYGGWWWTEVMYDLYVIHSNPQLPKSPPATGGQEDSRSSPQ
jgi:hypothetical protein